VIAAIRTHHDELAVELRARTNAVLTAVEGGEYGAAHDRLHDWYRTELMPHIVAEEQALYRPASDLETTRLLVLGMLAEHQALVAMIADLALTQRPFDVAAIAASAQSLFVLHLGKENDLLLPALDDAGLHLVEVLAGMHAILGQAEEATTPGHDCGCRHGDAVLDPTPTAATGSGELDVRVLPHGQRHEIIFARLDALEPGAELVIVNDHDPKPLRYQTEALWPGRFAWTYLQAGAQTWRLSIRRVG
jgi:uncharacterized protein (DUF2249 family)